MFKLEIVIASLVKCRPAFLLDVEDCNCTFQIEILVWSDESGAKCERNFQVQL